MATNAIVQKINDVLFEGVKSEAEVLYVMVELRKLLDLSRDSKAVGKVDFLGLRFYCDWVVHHVLDRDGAKEIVRHFDAYQNKIEEAEAAGEERGGHFRPPALVEILNLARFRGEFAQFCVLIGIDTSVSEDDSEWGRFLGHYLRIVEDIHLRCKNRSFQFVNEVILNVQNSAHGKVTIEWRWDSEISGAARAIQVYPF